MREYDFLKNEKKWQKYWEENKTYKTDSYSDKKKFYALDMFPYPSGAGLHVGHPEGYTATDILSRMKRMQGYEVMHPMGWDAFGLPAEQYAIQTGNNPREFTKKNIETFKEQIKSLGFSYDWDRELSTTDPKYYKWTQWIFSKLFEKGLAQIKEVPVNFCPECKTVLANEEVINGKCERRGHDVIKKPMKQWVLKITEYADRLLEDLEELDWPESLKDMQRNWIGKSQGTRIEFKVENIESVISVFTTRPDTIYGVNFLAIAVDHDLVNLVVTEDKKEEVSEYIKSVINKSDLERTELNKNKSGIFSGSYAIHPLTGKKVEIWLADYVLKSYGTGCVMAVGAHDARDYEFCQKYKIKLIQVIDGDLSKGVIDDKGVLINSGEYNGLMSLDAGYKITKYLDENNLGGTEINYKLRDWLFSRQRYWGEPFPIYFNKEGKPTLVDEEDLPIKLPHLDKIEPTKTGDSPLLNATDWLKYKDGTLDTNTMPQWAGSCWYYLRYVDPNNDSKLIDPELEKMWLPVDVYIGGAEHAVLHLLYARFWHKFLYDIGVVSTKEPFQKLFNQGMILGDNNEKMSKSKGNVINPDDIVISHGADALRVYEMFMGPLDASIAWSDTGLDGAKKFLDRIYTLYATLNIVDENKNLDKIYNQTVKKVETDYENLNFNTAISQLMIYINALKKESVMSRVQAEGFLKLIAPIAPHVTEEIWHEILGNKNTIHKSLWPVYDEKMTEDSQVEIIIQINGKLIEKRIVEINMSKSDMQQIADEVSCDKEVIKTILVPNKLINIVVK